MQKVGFLAASVFVLGGATASAADLPVKFNKAQSIAPIATPWDIAFGGAAMSNYVFRGVTQSNHKPSVTAYVEPRFNVNPNLQLYVGSAFASVSLTNRAAAEVDVYGGIRPTFGALALDFGVWGYLYPGGQCVDTVQGGGNLCPLGSNALVNGNIMKKDASFYEFYGKANYTFSDHFSLGANVNYSPNFLNSGANGTYASVLGKVTAPSNWLGSHGVGAYLSGEFGRQWLGTSDTFYSSTNFADYNTWNVGIGFTWQTFTLDLRYSDTDLSKGDCNAFTSDFRAADTSYVTPINSSGAGSNWCGATFIAKLSADLTAAANLK